MVNIPCKIVCILGLSWCGTMLNTREIQIQSTAESFQIWICSKVWRSLFRKEEIYISSVFFSKICMFASHRVNWMWLAIPEDFRMRMNIKQKHDVFVNVGCRRKKCWFSECRDNGWYRYIIIRITLHFYQHQIFGFVSLWILNVCLSWGGGERSGGRGAAAMLYTDILLTWFAMWQCCLLLFISFSIVFDAVECI